MEIFSKSDKFKQEYSCKVIRMGELQPVEGSDFLAQTIVDGYSMVVRKDEFKEGDLLFYATIETELNENFVGANNLFDMECYEKNRNAKEVAKAIEEVGKDEARKMIGFFNKYGRVKMIRLRGCPSMGFLFGLDSMAVWKPEVANISLEDYLDTEFDTVCGDLFIKAYVPRTCISARRGGGGSGKRSRKMKKLVGTYKVTEDFHRHYDTNPLQKNMHVFKPTDVVAISTKIHGTSVIIGNQRVMKFREYGLKDKAINRRISKEKKVARRQFLTRRDVTLEMYCSALRKLREKMVPQPFDIRHKVVYSSRNVIQNSEFSREELPNFYNDTVKKVNVYEKYGRMLGRYIPEGWTVYGEIFGYVDGESDRYMQGKGKEGFDYGCEVGDNKMMPYRITVLDEKNGKMRELDVKEVLDWTVKLIKEHYELKAHIEPLDLLYHGTLKDLYPELSTEEHWHENVLERIKHDDVHFGMEKNEPLCKNKVPREGIVLRIDGDMLSEAFKCKCVKFLDMEKKKMDKGEVDTEMLEADY